MTNLVIKLTSTDQTTLPGTGLVKFCYVPPHLELQVGQRLKIDGTLYRLRGIEKRRKLMYPPILCRDMGLVVTPWER